MFRDLGPSPFFDGFRLVDAQVADDVTLRAAIGGEGPPLLLLHGHPQTHVTWRKIAPALARRFTIVAADLRGYGDSSTPESDADHRPYSKRAMAEDMVTLMIGLGHERFGVAGHDRGGRVAHRMALDHPDRIDRLAMLDIAPTLTMYERTDRAFATRYFWWFFLIQPEPLPERMIAADPEFFVREHIARQVKVPGATEPEAMAEYLRCYADPATRHSICEDYRASAGIDLEHDRQDGDRKLAMPLLALWGAQGTVGALYDVLQTWRDKAEHVEGNPVDCGHKPQEERPDETLDAFIAFFGR